MPLYNQASFKNSRVASRKPTTESNVYKVQILNTSPNTLVAPATPNRTYITLRSQATAIGDDIVYDYHDNPNILTEGFTLKSGEAVDLESPTAIYARAVVNNVPCSIDEGQG